MKIFDKFKGRKLVKKLDEFDISYSEQVETTTLTDTTVYFQQIDWHQYVQKESFSSWFLNNFFAVIQTIFWECHAHLTNYQLIETEGSDYQLRVELIINTAEKKAQLIKELKKTKLISSIAHDPFELISAQESIYGLNLSLDKDSEIYESRINTQSKKQDNRQEPLNRELDQQS